MIKVASKRAAAIPVPLKIQKEASGERAPGSKTFIPKKLKTIVGIAIITVRAVNNRMILFKLLVTIVE